MVQNYGYGFDINPIHAIDKVTNYAKRILNDVESGIKGITNIPQTVQDLSKKGVGSVGTVLMVVAVGIAGYLIFAGKKGTKLTP
jgi:hypothetical protein